MELSLKLYSFIYIMKKLLFYFFLLIITYFVVTYLVIDLLWASLSSPKIYFYIFPNCILLYQNVIKSRSYKELFSGILIIVWSIYIFNHYDNLIIKTVETFLEDSKINKKYIEFYSKEILALIFINLYFILSIFVKFISNKYSKNKFPEFKTNPEKFLKIIFISLFYIPFAIPGMLLLFLSVIEIVTNFTFSFYMYFSKCLIYLQITNIFQLYLNVYLSKNSWEKSIGFLVFCENLLLSLIYITLKNDKDLPVPSIYFSVYFTFFPVTFALFLKYVTNEVRIRHENRLSKNE